MSASNPTGSPHSWRWVPVRDGGDSFRWSLSVAVRVVDMFTGRAPRRRLDVSIHGVEAVPARGRHGHYLFLNVDLPSNEITVSVRGGTWYEDTTVTAALSDADDPTPPEINPRKSAVVIELTPSTQYPFPADATLVRGVVRDEREGADDPVNGATVSVVGTDRVGRTDETGEFAVVLEPASDNPAPSSIAVDRADGRWMTMVDGRDPTLVATGGEGIADSVETPPLSISVVAGRTTRAVLSYVDAP